MTKKDFKQSVNPAMQFINQGLSEEIAKEPRVEEKVTPSPVIKEKVTKTEQKKETKSKRLNLLLQPSLMEDLSKIAFMKKDSVNNLINATLTSYRDDNRELIEKYNKVFEG